MTEEIEAVLRKIEYWHQGSISAFEITCKDDKGLGIEFSGTAKAGPFGLGKTGESELEFSVILGPARTTK